jgi:hypothetical protein
MKQENEDIFGKMACNFHLCPLCTKWLFILVYTYLSDGTKKKKESRNTINLSEKEKNLHFSDKTLYTSKSPE